METAKRPGQELEVFVVGFKELDRARLGLTLNNNDTKALEGLSTNKELGFDLDTSKALLVLAGNLALYNHTKSLDLDAHTSKMREAAYRSITTAIGCLGLDQYLRQPASVDAEQPA